MDRKQIQADYLYVTRKIQEISDPKSGRRNLIVVKQHWISPTIGLKDMPLDHLNGELQYFTRIHSALEEALSTGKISNPNGLPDRTPAYVNELFA